MNLLIAERLMLLEILPKEGDCASLKEVRKAREALSVTPEEEKDLEFRHDGSRYLWNIKGATYLKDIPLSEWMTTTVQDELRDRNKKKKLLEREMSLYEKFIVAYDQV
jgi:hypothetical protein